MVHKKRVWDQLLWLGFCLLLATGLASATTLTGTLKASDGTLLNGNLYLSFSQQVALLNGCGGPALIPPVVQAVYPVTNGAVNGTAYGLDCISPSSNVYYHAVFQDKNNNKVFDVQWNCITGGVTDVGTCVPIAVNPTTTVVQGPQGPQGPATIAVGTTTTGPPGTVASVTNSGTSSAFVLNFTIPRGDTGATGTAPNYGASFTNQTSVTITGVAHAFNTANVLVQCYDNSSPARAIVPANWTVNASTFDVTINFAIAQSGYCALAGGRGPAGVPGPTCSNVPATWSAVTAYTTGQCAISSNNLWFALQNSTNQTPAYTSTFWLSLGGPGPSANVYIIGGSIDGTPIGATAPNTGIFTTLNSTGGALNGTIGATTPAAGTFTTVSASGQITSTLVTGTAPFVVASTTQVANLNVSQLESKTWEIPGTIGSTTPNTGAFTSITVTSTSQVANLNASQLESKTWEIPGTIGSTTPNTAAFTTISRTSYEDVAAIAAPGNPASGGRFYVDNVTGNLACKNSVGASCLANVGQRTCAFGFGAQNGPVLVTADINPQPTQCFIAAAATVTSIVLMVDTGTSSVNVVIPNGSGGTISLAALTPATVTNITDKVACANVGGTAITIARVSVTCSALSSSSLNAGDVINSGGTGAADGTTHRMSVFVTYQLS